jgi:hypothetical protein
MPLICYYMQYIIVNVLYADTISSTFSSSHMSTYVHL